MRLRLRLCLQLGIVLIICITNCVNGRYRSRMKFHFKLLQVEPLLWLGGVQVMVKVSCCVTKTVELLVRAQQNGGWRLLIGHARVTALPAPSNRSTLTNCNQYVTVCVLILNQETTGQLVTISQMLQLTLVCIAHNAPCYNLVYKSTLINKIKIWNK